MKRKIDLKKLKGITVGTLGSEFVLHVPEEYDYRYSSPERFLFINSQLLIQLNHLSIINIINLTKGETKFFNQLHKLIKKLLDIELHFTSKY